MLNAIIASAALLAAPALVSAGSAIVINSCSYDVQMANVPSSGGGQSEIAQTLSSGGSYTQEWTSLTNGNGWSIKLCKDDSMSNILQYEYTFHNDGIIWYDLSEVNGNPWDANWEITATGSCSPRQAAYRFATDDAYGMQSCPDSSSITVTLCSGDSEGGAAPSSSPEESQPAYTSAPSATEPASTAEPTPTSYPSWGPPGGAEKNAPAGAPAHLKKEHIHRLGNGAKTVTSVHTEYQTQYVTASPLPKRHEHHARHAHNA